jgi:hypothetical protein
MKRSTLLLTLAAGLAFSPFARAETMTKGQYDSAKKPIEATAKAGLSGCDTLAANAKDICVAEVKGKESVAMAELEAQYEPTATTHKAVHTAKAEAAYKVSMERCDGRAGNDKDVCVKEAKAARVTALSDAQSQAAISNANAKASTVGSEARQEAAGEKAGAEYAVAKEKCNGLAGDTRDTCVNDAKARYGQR